MRPVQRPAAPPRARILQAVSNVPAGRVATLDVLAAYCRVPERLVLTVLTNLSEGERETVPWHRVVARGGAIGRGAWGKTQIARLAGEGLAVAPAGIVQDLARFALAELDAPVKPAPQPASSPAAGWGRSRGMKDRP